MMCHPILITFFVANIEAKTKEDHTPLHFAARNDAVDSARALVMKGAVKEARDYKKRTPLLLAAVLGMV